MVAPTKAVAVWPEGHELAVLPSGRISEAVYLMPFTKPAISPYDMAAETSVRVQSERPSTPPNFRPMVSAGEKN